MDRRKKRETGEGSSLEILRETQMAILNILEDFNAEKSQLEKTQRAMLNILQDFDGDRQKLQDTQKALLNILDDLNQSNEELKRAHDVLELRVKERTAELARSNAELEAFSYSVSHDLRAPLRSIDGFTRMILEEYADRLDARGKEFFSHIRSSSLLMAQLIDDLLRLSRIGRAEMWRQEVNLSELARSVAEELLRAHPERNAEVVISPGMTTQGDRSLLKILLQNFLENAWKYTSKVETARIEFGATRLGGEEVFFIRDNGVGFNTAYAGKLFQPFQRLHSKKEFPGTGIGLAIVQRIVSRHGGRVWAEGEVNQGAAFYFTLGGQ